MATHTAANFVARAVEKLELQLYFNARENSFIESGALRAETLPVFQTLKISERLY